MLLLSAFKQNQYSISIKDTECCSDSCVSIYIGKFCRVEIGTVQVEILVFTREYSHQRRDSNDIK